MGVGWAGKHQFQLKPENPAERRIQNAAERRTQQNAGSQNAAERRLPERRMQDLCSGLERRSQNAAERRTGQNAAERSWVLAERR